MIYLYKKIETSRMLVLFCLSIKIKLSRSFFLSSLRTEKLMGRRTGQEGLPIATLYKLYRESKISFKFLFKPGPKSWRQANKTGFLLTV